MAVRPKVANLTGLGDNVPIVQLFNPLEEIYDPIC